jgi:hypothetical protein
MMAFVFAYRCGAVPDFHRLPSCRDHNILCSTSNWGQYIGLFQAVNSRKTKIADSSESEEMATNNFGLKVAF